MTRNYFDESMTIGEVTENTRYEGIVILRDLFNSLEIPCYKITIEPENLGSHCDRESHWVITVQDSLEEGTLKTVAQWSFEPMPGCCGIMISTSAYVDFEYRNIGIGSILNKLRVKLARDMGISLLFCTDVVDNKPQRKILEKNGWSELCQFINSKTGNLVALHVIYTVDK